MSNVEKIQEAEQQVARMQETLQSVQAGLERAERVATAAEEAKQRSEQTLKVVMGLVGLSVVILALSLRRSRR
jgi:hypothetical protein